MSLTKDSLVLRCCYLFYQEQMTIQEIAESLDISRFKVSRYIKEAQERGIVQVQFLDPNIEYERLGFQLERALQLRRVVVAPTPYDAPIDTVRSAVGRGGADLFSDIAPDTILGITWGRTVAYMVEALPSGKLKAQTVVDLAGGFGQISSSLSARAVTLRTAEKLNADCVQLPAPTIVDSVDMARSLLAESTIRRTLDIAAKAQIAVTGIGPINADTLLYHSGFLSEGDVSRLAAAGAVGSIIGRFYDIDGNELATEFRDRAIALKLSIFREIPERIAFGGGDAKVSSIIGLARGQLINTLVTDSKTATLLLEAVGGQPSAPTASTDGKKRRTKTSGST